MENVNITLDVLLPLAVIAVCAWFVPKGLARWVRESLPGLWLNAALSGVVLSLLSGVIMLVALGQGAPSLWLYAWWLGLKFAIVWVPIMLLSLVMQPQHWELNE